MTSRMTDDFFNVLPFELEFMFLDLDNKQNKYVKRTNASMRLDRMFTNIGGHI